VRVGTFNAENLFARYRFGAGFQPTFDGFTVNDVAFDLMDDTAKRITAQAIKLADADVLALEEVESLPVLDRFNSRYLGASPAKTYRNRVLIDGNDPRAIDVAVIARTGFDITAIRTHRDRRRIGAPGVKVFSRDCLEVDVAVPAQGAPPKRFTLFVNHLKSMMGGREETADRRLEQSEAVLEIVTDRFGPGLDADFAIVGDLNDHVGAYGSGRANPLAPLLDHPQLVNAVAELEGANGWTHYFDDRDEYTQLDYLLVSRRLWEATGNGADLQVDIVRAGMPLRAERHEGPRIDGVGQDNPKASDHCPVVLDIPDRALG
jgi:endonuclease/exonuclease/phosphatase family metal-dependent hydrolase